MKEKQIMASSPKTKGCIIRVEVTTDDAVLGRVQDADSIRDFLLHRGVQAMQNIAGYCPLHTRIPSDFISKSLRSSRSGSSIHYWQYVFRFASANKIFTIYELCENTIVIRNDSYDENLVMEIALWRKSNLKQSEK